MPIAIKRETVDIQTKCIVYADDLAICCHSVESLQACLDHLLVYCTGNLLKVNVSKTKSVKFRRGGRLSRNDKLFQTNGGNSEHLEMVKRKGKYH